MADLHRYHCPRWAKCLNQIPKYRIELANAGTPIHRWSLPGTPAGYEVSIKRDDMTGCTLSGNKVKAEDIVDIIDGHEGKGYNKLSQEERDFVASVAETTGIMLDPVYTGKAALGMLRELKTNPHRFKGNRILFLHTGGIFGMYDGRLDTTITCKARTNTMHMWSSTDSPPMQIDHTT